MLPVDRWDCHYLYCKKIINTILRLPFVYMDRLNKLILISFLLVLFNQTQAQKPKPLNLPRFDQKYIHFGFILGINNADFTLQKAAPVSNPLLDTCIDVYTQRMAGFNLGIVSELHMHKYLKLRFVPTLSFSQRNLHYQFFSPAQNESVNFVKPVESTYIEFPLLLKIKSERLNNFSAYLITGGKYTLDLASDEFNDNQALYLPDMAVRIKKHDIHYEAGFGTEFYLPYFKFGIELKMSYGIRNLIVREKYPIPSTFTDPIDRLRSKIFLLSFTFEG